jgi:hypothetical protein
MRSEIRRRIDHAVFIAKHHRGFPRLTRAVQFCLQ